MNSTTYETPRIEVIEIDVEKGFAGSPGNCTTENMWEENHGW